MSWHCNETLPVVLIVRGKRVGKSLTVVPEQMVTFSAPDFEDASTEDRLAYVAVKNVLLPLS